MDHLLIALIDCIGRKRSKDFTQVSLTLMCVVLPKTTMMRHRIIMVGVGIRFVFTHTSVTIMLAKLASEIDAGVSTCSK
jgi:hypothetical protein